MNGTTYHYNASGQRTGKRWPNGIAATSTYDEADRLVAIAHSGQIGEVAYGLNPAGLRLTRTQSNAGQPTEIESYTYDGADQITAVGGPRAFSATYDPVGNRTHATQGGSSTAYTANPVNQYTLAGQEPLAYDPNGNLTQMGVRWSASYDGANRLVQAQAQGNTMTVAYDAFHRPVTRTINGRTLHMVWDGWRLAEEREADATLAALYTHGQGPDEILSRTDAQGATLCYHHDGLGNTLALTDSTGQVVERYSYDAFGTPHVYDAALNPQPSSSVHNRFLFTGREWLPELNLYDYRNRVYSAELGRFLQTDPIRFDAGDMNLYRYCGNDPVNKVDPIGDMAQCALVFTPVGPAIVTATTLYVLYKVTEYVVNERGCCVMGSSWEEWRPTNRDTKTDGRPRLRSKEGRAPETEDPTGKPETDRERQHKEKNQDGGRGGKDNTNSEGRKTEGQR